MEAKNARSPPRRPGHCVGQDLDHSIFDLLGCQSPTLRAIRSGLGDQGSGDVVAIASAFLDGVRWGEPLALGIGQQTRQQAGLGGVGLTTMVARIGSKLVIRVAF